MIAEQSTVEVKWTRADADAADFVFFDTWAEPFVIEGNCAQGMAEKRFLRIPESLFPHVNDGVVNMAGCCAGICIRFVTDSPSVAVSAEIPSSSYRHHFAPRGAEGLDVYAGPRGAHVFCQAVGPMEEDEATIQNVANSPLHVGAALQPWTVYLPIYGGCKSVSIGVKKGSRLEAPPPHTVKDPVLFYGSSITQGGCASRAGLVYTHIVTRKLDCGMVNLGFSGSAKGETAMAEYIAQQPMAAFVFDYDHNAGIAHLRDTHKPFFDIIRAAQPDLPIVMMSRCDFEEDAAGGIRRAIIYRTWEQARSKGDTRVWFVDGEKLFGTTDRDACTVDGCHPNDIGFMRMAEALQPTLHEALICKMTGGWVIP